MSLTESSASVLEILYPQTNSRSSMVKRPPRNPEVRGSNPALTIKLLLTPFSKVFKISSCIPDASIKKRNGCKTQFNLFYLYRPAQRGGGGGKKGVFARGPRNRAAHHKK